MYLTYVYMYILSTFIVRRKGLKNSWSKTRVNVFTSINCSSFKSEKNSKIFNVY